MIARTDMIDGAAKALAVLESFDTHRQKLNATQAAAKAGLSRAAARRHLLTLAHLGYLEEENGQYGLTSKVLRFSGSYLASARLPKLVQPVLYRLSAQTGHAFSVAIRDQDEAVIVARSALMDKDRHLIAHGLHLGARLALPVTSTGRVLLAALTPPEWINWKASATLRRYTPHSVTDWSMLETKVAQVQKDDWAWVSQEHELGVQALAVPLRDMSGKTVAALNVVAEIRETQPQRFVKSMLPHLQDAAAEMLPQL